VTGAAAGRVARAWIALAATFGCGRVGYEPVAIDGLAPADTAAPGERGSDGAAALDALAPSADAAAADRSLAFDAGGAREAGADAAAGQADAGGAGDAPARDAVSADAVIDVPPRPSDAPAAPDVAADVPSPPDAAATDAPADAPAPPADAPAPVDAPPAPAEAGSPDLGVDVAPAPPDAEVDASPGADAALPDAPPPPPPDGPDVDAAVDAAPAPDAPAAADAEPDAGAADATPDGPGALEYCAALPVLASAPVIDGVLEPGLALRPIDPVRWTGPSPIPAGQVADMAVAWRSDSLYFFVRVTDSTRVPARPGDEPWCGDGVELYVDDNGTYAAAEIYDNPGTRQFVVAAPGDATNTVARGSFYVMGPETVWSSSEFRAFPTPTGYVVEARITAADLGLSSWTLAADGVVGMDISINVSHDQAQGGRCMNRLGQYYLRIVTPPKYNDTLDEPFRNPEAFCRPRLRP
jgi:hypothetical protein